jgi:hypothetical protein
MNPRTRNTPLRREASFDNGPRVVNTPPRPINANVTEYEDVSPLSYHSRQAGLEVHSPYYDRSELRHISSRTPQYNQDHVSVCSTDSEPHLNTTNPIQAVPRNLFAPDQLSSILGKQQTREDRLRILRQDALNNFLPATSAFFGEKLMVTTGKSNRKWIGQRDIY